MTRDEELAAIDAAVRAGKVNRCKMMGATSIDEYDSRLARGQEGLALKRKRQAAQRKSIVSRARNRRKKEMESAE